jgi:hypothetical protein
MNRLFPNNDDFDKSFNRARNFIIAIWIIGVIGSLPLVGAGIYVAIHFLSKVW